MWSTCPMSRSPPFCLKTFFRGKTPCEASSSRGGRGNRGSGVVWHDLCDKDLYRTHGLGMAEATPLEGTDEVIGPGSDILVHVYAYGVWSTGDHAESGTPPIASNAARSSSAALLFFRAGAAGLECTGGLAGWYTRGPREPVRPEKLREPTAFSLHPARCHQVPDVLVPGWCGCRYGFFVG